MRTAIWASLSAAALLTSLGLQFAQLPSVGGGLFPYHDYIPKGGGLMLIASALLIIVGIVLLMRRARSRLWFAYALTAVLPLALAIGPACSELTYAENDWGRHLESSDVWGHIEVAKISLFIGLTLAATLLNISVYGYFVRRSAA